MSIETVAARQRHCDGGAGSTTRLPVDRLLEQRIGAVQVTTTTAIAAQALEAVCDECAGDGQLAYDLEASMWVPRGATADWPTDDCIGISVLDCLQCDGTGTVRLDTGRGNRASVRRSNRRTPTTIDPHGY